ncbi:uncharacterized protein LOC113790926 isoform X1 [Dermatophagoides pteronyssinus]|uniref:uncharacterized protein LOC113790926 isoform X1 n=2 Tax=Dermatophagoides pteronyssinus TaxID=6956 RepID=UPI003F67888C
MTESKVMTAKTAGFFQYKQQQQQSSVFFKFPFFRIISRIIQQQNAIINFIPFVIIRLWCKNSQLLRLQRQQQRGRYCPLNGRLKIIMAIISLIIISILWPLLFNQSANNLFSIIILVHAQPQSSQQNYIEYNLADYCSKETWSDYPGRHLIRLEKSLKIRLPSILDFQFNETHRQRMGFYRPGFYPNPMDNHHNQHNHQQQHNQQQQPSFVPYCLLSFTVDYGHRIYAEGLATELITGGKEWFTETLHFSRRSSSSSSMGLQNTPEIGTFTISTTKNSLTLVFEQLHLGPFSFHLILTPFRDAKPEFIFGCENEHEYKCTNERCIAKYLACDHHNNCGDYSDEHVGCMSRVPSTIRPLLSPSSRQPEFIPPDGRDNSGQITDNLPDRPPTSKLPTFPIDIDHTSYDGGGGSFDSDTIPEYFDIPFPGRDKTTNGPGTTTIFHKPKPMNGFHGTDVHTGGGGFLGDLFRFDSEHTSNVVKVVRYLLALLLIIILVTLINFLIWCLITKRDQSFIAASPPPPPPPVEESGSPIPQSLSGAPSPSLSQQHQRQLPPISVISV